MVRGEMMAATIKLKKKFNKKQFLTQSLLRIFLFLLIISILMPLLFIFTTSFTTEVSYLKEGVRIFPKEMTLKAYELIFSKPIFLKSMYNSIFITIIGSVLSLVVTALMAYPLSKSFLPGRRQITFIMYMSGLFNGGIIPTWLIVRATGLYDSLWSLIIVLMIMPWLVVLLRNFFMNVPHEIEEAARIDGCGIWQTFMKIILPMSLPALATTFLFYSLFKWNEWFYAIVFIGNRESWPLQVFLRDTLLMGSVSGGASGIDASQGIPSETYKMALVVLSTIPILVLYPFIQKFFIKGLMVGSVKG